MNLRQPLWPGSRFNLTTPLDLLLMAAAALAGVWLYARGYTYEGSVLVYMLGTVIFTRPYYVVRYTGFMTWLVLGSLVPMTIWLQNKGVEVQLWHYPKDKDYLLDITKTGEGWWKFTRHAWLGNDMPAMEYLFYPLFGYFHMTGFALFSHLMPDRHFEQEQRKLRHAFVALMGSALVVFLLVYRPYHKPEVTDYTYWMTGLLGFAATFGCWFVSPGLRSYTRTPAFWIWVVLVGVVFMTLWEGFHCCINHDWVYDLNNTFPPAYIIRGSGIPFTDFFGYLVTATTFQALMYFFITVFGHVVVRNPALVPFSRRRPGTPPSDPTASSPTRSKQPPLT